MRMLMRRDLYLVLCWLSFGCRQGEISFGTAADELLTVGLDAAQQEARTCACAPPSGGLWATFQVGS